MSFSFPSRAHPGWRPDTNGRFSVVWCSEVAASECVSIITKKWLRPSFLHQNQRSHLPPYPLAGSQRQYATSIRVATRAKTLGTSVFVRVLPLPLHGKPFSRTERRSKSLFRFRDIEGERNKQKAECRSREKAEKWFWRCGSAPATFSLISALSTHLLWKQAVWTVSPASH